MENLILQPPEAHGAQNKCPERRVPRTAEVQFWSCGISSCVSLMLERDLSQKINLGYVNLGAVQRWRSTYLASLVSSDSFRLRELHWGRFSLMQRNQLSETPFRKKPIPSCFFPLCWDLPTFLLSLAGGSSLPPNPCSSLDCKPLILHWRWWKQSLLAPCLLALTLEPTPRLLITIHQNSLVFVWPHSSSYHPSCFVNSETPTHVLRDTNNEWIWLVLRSWISLQPTQSTV